MMRFAYAVLTYLLLPVYASYWVFRGLGNRTYWDRFGQRFGIGYPKFVAGCIWDGDPDGCCARQALVRTVSRTLLHSFRDTQFNQQFF